MTRISDIRWMLLYLVLITILFLGSALIPA